MDIKIKETLVVSNEREEHYRLEIGNKEILVSRYIKSNEFGIENETEIFKGKELLTEEEQEEVIEFMENL